jgi:hypothetical protein
VRFPPFRRLIQLTDFNETWHEYYFIRSYPTLISQYQHGGHSKVEGGSDTSTAYYGTQKLCDTLKKLKVTVGRQFWHTGGEEV